MSADRFLDTNVLLYACSSAVEDAVKRERAEALMLEAPFVFSAQVVQEFIANALRKPALGITEDGIDALLKLARHVGVTPMTLPLVTAAVGIRRTHRIGHWDAAIVAAAIEMGCQTLYSEDLQDGREFGGLRVVNPFVGG